MKAAYEWLIDNVWPIGVADFKWGWKFWFALLAFLILLVVAGVVVVSVAHAETITCVYNLQWLDVDDEGRPIHHEGQGGQLKWRAVVNRPGVGPCSERPVPSFVPGRRSSARVEWELVPIEDGP